MPKKKARKKISILLDMDIVKYLKKLSKLSGVDESDCICVVLASHLLREKQNVAKT